MTATPTDGASHPTLDEDPTLPPEGVSQKSTAGWIGVLLILVLLSEEVAYAFNLVTPALPNMAATFQTPYIAWVSTLFTLTGAISAPLVGKLADRDGKKKWLLITTGCMAVGSLIVALAPTFPLVLVGRAVEGFGLAIVPIVYSLMRDIFPKRMLAVAVSLATAGIGVTTITGPIFAGLLIDNFGYRGVFFALAVFPVLIGALVLLVVPESPVRVRTQIDWTGGLLLGLTVAILLFGIGEGGTWGWTSWKTLLCAALAIATFAIWIQQAKRSANPLIDLSVLRGRPVVTTLITQFTGQAVIALQFVLLSFIVQTPISLGLTYGLGEDASFMARITTPAGFASVLMGFLVGYLAERRGARLPNWIGFCLMAVGSLALALSHTEFTPILLGYLVYAFGGGLISAAIPNLVIAATPVRLQAVTASTVNVVGSLGSAIAVQIGFAILALNVATVVNGSPIYGGSGFTAVYILAAALAVIGLVATLLMPHGRKSQSSEALT
ncbi:MFS transporter [Rhodococcus sp. T2V]|uniref:MFS transporter n=1 Tax=Rhodococcus sp. T2V TaxID=3034164 RepID=UPI0023E0B192|nr:MFS transporter [Rhodococcus sp. T2V]MDF3313274.1 MFS transporter [Rhodococcus sp. T2V]